MEPRPDSEADAEVELTPEAVVAADEAMLLDLGGAEQLADLIAAQSLGETVSRTPPGPDPPVEAATAPPDGDDQASSTSGDGLKS